MEVTTQPPESLDFADLDREIAHAGDVLRLAEECGFAELAAGLRDDLADSMVPNLTILICATDGVDRQAAAERLRRVRGLLGRDDPLLSQLHY
jgi:hypothetical protein